MRVKYTHSLNMEWLQQNNDKILSQIILDMFTESLSVHAGPPVLIYQVAPSSKQATDDSTRTIPFKMLPNT